MKKNHKLFWYQEGFLNTHTQSIIWYNTNYVGKTMYLAIILLLVKYRIQNHWSDAKHNAKVRAVN